MRHIQVVSLRMVREKTVHYSSGPIETSYAAYELFRDLVKDMDRESFWIACMNTKNRLTCLSQISLGTLNTAPVSAKDVYKVALLSNASGVLFVHNHPSGEPEPSSEDRNATMHLKAAAAVLGIRVLDHLIIGETSYYSFRDNGGL